MTFAKAVRKQEKKAMTTTENGMPMRVSSKDYAVDLFFNIGAMRLWTEEAKISAFDKAFSEDEEITTRILLWSRDVRGGAGERSTFNTIVKHLCVHNFALAERILFKIPELGRWDDVLTFLNTPAEFKALELISTGLNNEDGLCAKWMPRHKSLNKQAKRMTDAGASVKEIENALAKINAHNSKVVKIRKHMSLNFKNYRKLLSKLSSTVEQQMCGKEWGEINYSHVPSVASKKYRKAFNRNDQERYQEYLNKLTKGDSDVKINAEAIFPHDVLSPMMKPGFTYRDTGITQQEEQLVEAQWAALPDYMDGTKVLPMVDTSGSMGCIIGGSTTAMQVAMSLGIYMSSKNTGDMKDVILTFSKEPTLLKLEGNLKSNINQLAKAPWGMNTNIEKAFNRVLKLGIRNSIPKEDMPEVMLILSDMQFDACTRDPSASVMQMIKSAYKKHGYKVPKIVFWNLKAKGTTPVKALNNNTALVSGFSPSILTAILGSIEDFTPTAIMMKAIMNERYNY